MNRKRALKTALVGFSAALGILAIVIATRPATFHIERSVTIAAPQESAFAQVNDFHAWEGWSPFEKLDTQMDRKFEGPSSGVGASYAWAGKQAGEGRMTIEKSDLSQIAIKLEFFKPMKSTNKASFTFAKEGDGTRVTWAMDGENTFLGKAASLFLDIDKLVGGDFEKGLVALKATAESTPRKSAAR